jgi:multicomponent Na+:H+ antiporter subunit E
MAFPGERRFGMFWVLWILWLVLNGRLGWDVVLLGAVLSALLTLFGQKICGWSTKLERFFFLHAGSILAYLWALLIEILRANFAVIRVILSPKKQKELHPEVVFFDSGLTSSLAKTALANSITITPGTYTLGIYGTTFAVHELDASFAADGDNPLQHGLAKLEADAKKEGLL